MKSKDLINPDEKPKVYHFSHARQRDGMFRLRLTPSLDMTKCRRLLAKRSIRQTLIHTKHPEHFCSGHLFLFHNFNYKPFSSSFKTALSITLAPSVHCSTDVCSGSQCESPLSEGTKIIVVGSIYDTYCASWPAPELMSI